MVTAAAAAADVCRATITVALVDFVSGTGRQHMGAASSTIHNQKVRQITADSLYLAVTPFVGQGQGRGGCVGQLALGRISVMGC